MENQPDNHLNRTTRLQLANPTPSLEDWLGACQDLHRVGSRWEGSCPACGGEDRFTIKPGNNATPIIYCRGCEPSKANGVAYRQILEAAGLAEERSSRDQNRRPREKRSNTFQWHSRKTVRNKIPVGSIWAFSEAIAGTPAEDYLIRRLATSPEPNLTPHPQNLRWIPKGKLHDFMESLPDHNGKIRLPVYCSGVLTARYECNGETVALVCEGLLPDGRRPDWIGKDNERYRRTIGSLSGGVFFPGGDRGRKVVVSEGHLSAVALSILHPHLEALALGGTSGYRSIPNELIERVVIIDTDGDQAGIKARNALLERMTEYDLGAPEIATNSYRKDALDKLAKSVLNHKLEMLTLRRSGAWEVSFARVWAERKWNQEKVLEWIRHANLSAWKPTLTRAWTQFLNSKQN